MNVDSCTPFLPLILLSFCLGLYLFQDATPLQTIPLQTLICACRTYKKTWSASIGHPDNCVFSLVAPPSEASLVKFCRAFKVWVLVGQSWKASVVSHWSGNHWGDGGIGHESPRYAGFSFQLNLTRLRPMWFYRCLSCLRRTSSVSETHYCLSGLDTAKNCASVQCEPSEPTSYASTHFFWIGHYLFCVSLILLPQFFFLYYVISKFF